MGRETGIARCVWRDDWLYLETGGQKPPATVAVHARCTPGAQSVHSRFDALPDEFQWLRTPEPDRIFRIEDGALVLIGRESIGSWFEQSLVARRQEHHAYDAETTVEFAPETYQHAAGLITYYNCHKFHGAFVTNDGNGNRVLTLMSCNGDWPDGALDVIGAWPIPDGPVNLSVQVRGATQQFYHDDQPLGPPRDAYIVSDEGGQGEHASFTGAFVGMMAFDLTGQGKEARFTRFGYKPKGEMT
jgi:xylan 1,4-beta-xylosidase